VRPSKARTYSIAISVSSDSWFGYSERDIGAGTLLDSFQTSTVTSWRVWGH
jgi:hypothetical protein